VCCAAVVATVVWCDTFPSCGSCCHEVCTMGPCSRVVVDVVWQGYNVYCVSAVGLELMASVYHDVSVHASVDILLDVEGGNTLEKVCCAHTEDGMACVLDGYPCCGLALQHFHALSA